MTDTSAFFAGRPSGQQTEFDQYDRYMLPDENGEYSGWTRATTFAATLAQQYGLRIWEQRQVVWGLAVRPDLLALANTISGPEDKKALGEIVDQAHAAAGTKAKANLGDAVHKATEAYDRGQPVPVMHTEDVAAYAREMQAYGYQVLPDYIERIVIIPQYHVAGRFDRLVMCPDGKIRVLDVKSGNLDYASVEFSVQLSLYGNAKALWDPVTKAYVPMPEVATDYAIIAHIPAGSGKCEMMQVNIDIGWALTRLCAEVRDAHQLKYLITPMPQRTALPPVPVDSAQTSQQNFVGKSYVVGENGPEIFIPKTEGLVSASHTRMGAEFWCDGRHEDDDGESPTTSAETPTSAPVEPSPAPVAVEEAPKADASVPTQAHADLAAAAREAQQLSATPQSVMAAAGAPVDVRPGAGADLEQLAQAIVKTAKTKARVQEVARKLCASLSLPESAIKLNQQQLKIAREIVALAVKQGVPVPGVPEGFVVIHNPPTTDTQPAEPSQAERTAAVADAVTTGPNPAFRESTMQAIAGAPTVGTLQSLRERLGHHWTDEMTEAARQRVEVLNAAEGQAALSPMEMITGATSKQTLSAAWKVATADGNNPDGWTAELHQAAQAKLRTL